MRSWRGIGEGSRMLLVFGPNGLRFDLGGSRSPRLVVSQRKDTP